MSDLRIALVGATGLVGRALIARAVGCEGVRIAAMARSRIDLPPGARMEMFVSDPAYWRETIEAIRPDVLVCALGTTWRKAGRTEAAFRAVDQQLVLEVAQAARDAGTRQMIAVSAVGADTASRSLYLRVKGEVERDLAKMRFTRLDILRPGLLRGRRYHDPRVAEKLVMLASPLTDLLLMGDWRRFHSISAKRLAEAILGLAQEKAGGRFTHEYDALLRAARRAPPCRGQA